MTLQVIHHIDGDPTNNHPSNLQIVTLPENLPNRSLSEKKHAAITRAALRRTIQIIEQQIKDLK